MFSDNRSLRFYASTSVDAFFIFGGFYDEEEEYMCFDCDVCAHISYVYRKHTRNEQKRCCEQLKCNDVKVS